MLARFLVKSLLFLVIAFKSLYLYYISHLRIMVQISISFIEFTKSFLEISHWLTILCLSAITSLKFFFQRFYILRITTLKSGYTYYYTHFRAMARASTFTLVVFFLPLFTRALHVDQNMMYIHHFANAMEFRDLIVNTDLCDFTLAIIPTFQSDYVVQVPNAILSSKVVRLLYDFLCMEFHSFTIAVIFEATLYPD